MSIFQRTTSRRNSPSASTNKKLRLESLERKNLLAGDVTASIVGGDLFLSGDIDDNSFQIVRDESQASPGTGEVTVRGLFGTTINGAATVDFNGANAITGDVLIDFGTNGQDSATIGVSPFIDPDVLALPGSVIIAGGSIGFDSISFTNTSVAGDVILDDLAGGDSANLSFQDSAVQGDIASNTTSEFSDIVLSRTDVGGDVSLASTTGSNSVLQTSTSTVGGNLSLTSDNDESAAFVRGTQVDGSILINTGGGDDSFIFGEDLLGDGVTVGNDVVISSGAGNDTFDLSMVDAADDIRIDAGAGQDELSLVTSAAGDDLRIRAGADGLVAFVSAITVGDDLEFTGGDGDDEFALLGDEGDNFIGDDVYVTGRQGNDIAAIEAATVGDKVRIALGAGDDESFVVESTIGHSVLISLGSGFNQSEIEDTDAGHYLTILARGTNELSLAGVTVTNGITLLTGSGSDVIELEGVTAHSTWIATYAGEDEVSITESDFNLLYVFLGSGDDTLTLDTVTVDWFAVLSGGSGEDTLIDVDDASDINFEIDFAFENFGV